MVTNDTILVSVDFNHGPENYLLVVGRKRLGHEIDIINAIEGPDARALYEMLITKEEKTKNE